MMSSPGPILQSVRIANGDASQLPLSPVLILKFSEPIVLGSGRIYLRAADYRIGPPGFSVDVSDGTQVQIVGQELHIRSATALAPGWTYELDLEEGVVRNAAAQGSARSVPEPWLRFSTVESPGDDHGGVQARATLLQAGASAQGVSQFAYDADMFRVELQAGSLFSYQLKAQGGAASALDVMSYSDRGYREVGESSFVALHTGSYYLMVYGLTGAGSVPYEISTQVVRDDVPPGTLPTLMLGAAAAGRIDHSADTDSFGIHLVRGKTYAFELTAGDNSAVAWPSLVLRDPQGEMLKLSNPHGSGTAPEIFWTAASSGLHVLEVEGRAGWMGGYSLRATEAAPGSADDYTTAAPGTLRPNFGKLSGRIETPKDVDPLWVELEAGKAYYFGLGAPFGGEATNLARATLTLFGPANEKVMVLEGALGLGRALVPAVGGSYRLEVAGQTPTDTGFYQVAVSSTADYGDDYSWQQPGRLQVGGAALTGKIESGLESDLFAVELVAGGSYAFDMKPSGGLVAELMLRGPGHELIKTVQGSGSKSSAQLSFTATSTGTYYLEAQDSLSNTGAYTLSATTTAPPAPPDDFPAGRIGRMDFSGTPMRGRIDFAGDSDGFEVPLYAGLGAEIELRGAGSTPLVGGELRLLTLDGRLLQALDLGAQAPTGSVRMRVLPEATGWYRVEVSASGATLGQYEVLGRQVDVQRPTLLAADPVSGSEGLARNPLLRFRFDEAGIRLGNGAIEIVDHGGRVVHRIDSQDATQASVYSNSLTLKVRADLQAGANYSVRMVGNAVEDLSGNAFNGFGQVGAYSFRTTAVDDFDWSVQTQGRLVPRGAAVQGRLEVSGDLDLFKVDLSQGQAYQFYLDFLGANRTGAGLVLYEPGFGKTLAQAGDSKSASAQLEFVAPRSGTYYLEVGGLSGQAGDYRVQISEPDRQAPRLLSSAPIDGALSVPRNAVVSLHFDEEIRAGSGSLELRRSDGLSHRFDLDDAAQVRIQGQVLSLDPSANLAPGSYVLSLPQGLVLDAAGNAYAGLASAVAFNVSAANTAPVSSPLALDLQMDRPSTAWLPAARDAEGDSLQWLLLTPPKKGSLQLAEDGRFVYRPEPGFQGQDSFSVQVRDALGAGSSYGVTLALRPLGEQWLGTAGDDMLQAHTGSDRYQGHEGNDLIAPGAGDDWVDGGAGRDTVLLPGSRAGYRVSSEAGGWQVDHAQQGSDWLQGVERLQFADGGLALDLDGVAGQAARLVATLFGAERLQDRALMGLALSVFDQGHALEAIAAAGLAQPLFLQLAGSGSHQDLVRQVYLNLVGAMPSAQDLGYFVSQLETGVFTPASLVAMASQTDWVAQRIDLVGLSETGLPFELFTPGG